MSIYSGQRNHTPVPQTDKPLRQVYAPFTKSSEQPHPYLVYFPPPEKLQCTRRTARNSDVYRKLVGRPLIFSRGSNYTTSLNTRIVQLKYNRPSQDCPFGRPKSCLANALEPPSSQVEAIEGRRTRVRTIFAERQAVGMSILVPQGNPLDSIPIITPLEMGPTTATQSTTGIPHNPLSLAVPKREAHPLNREGATESRGTSIITLGQSLANLSLHLRSSYKSLLPSPPMSPVQVQGQPQLNNDKRNRRRSSHRLSQQQQPTRVFCTRKPSLRRTSRQSILGKRAMGFSLDPFPTGTEKSPVEPPLSDANGAWDEGGRKMDKFNGESQNSFKHIGGPSTLPDLQVRHESSALSILRAYAAPLRINVTVETMTMATTAACGYAKPNATTIDLKPCLLPRLSVPVFSPFSVESLDPFYGPVPSLSYPQLPPTVSSSAASTLLITPETSPRLTNNDANKLCVHGGEPVTRNNGDKALTESPKEQDTSSNHVKTGVKEKKKPNLTLDMHVIEGYPTASRRKGEIVLVRESLGSSRRRNPARTAKLDETTQNDS